MLQVPVLWPAPPALALEDHPLKLVADRTKPSREPAIEPYPRTADLQKIRDRLSKSALEDQTNEKSCSGPLLESPSTLECRAARRPNKSQQEVANTRFVLRRG